MRTTSMTSPLSRQGAPAHEADDVLVTRARGGDTGAFSTLVERYQNLACAVAYSATSDFANSEDIAQDAFVTAWRRLENLSDAAKFAPWLAGIVRNAARSFRRHQRRHSPGATFTIDSLDQQADLTPSPLERAMVKQDMRQATTALQKLPQRYRDPFILYFALDESYTAVAQALSISEATVRQRLCRARKKLSTETVPVAATAARCGRSAALVATVMATVAARPTWAAPAAGKSALVSSKVVASVIATAGATAMVCVVALVTVLSQRTPQAANQRGNAAGDNLAPVSRVAAPAAVQGSNSPAPVPVQPPALSATEPDSAGRIASAQQGEVVIGRGKLGERTSPADTPPPSPVSAASPSRRDASAPRRAGRRPVRDAEVKHGPAVVRRTLLRPTINLNDAMRDYE